MIEMNAIQNASGSWLAVGLHHGKSYRIIDSTKFEVEYTLVFTWTELFQPKSKWVKMKIANVKMQNLEKVLTSLTQPVSWAEQLWKDKLKDRKDYHDASTSQLDEGNTLVLSSQKQFIRNLENSSKVVDNHLGKYNSAKQRESLTYDINGDIHFLVRLLQGAQLENVYHKKSERFSKPCKLQDLGNRSDFLIWCFFAGPKYIFICAPAEATERKDLS